MEDVELDNLCGCILLPEMHIPVYTKRSHTQDDSSMDQEAKEGRINKWVSNRWSFLVSMSNLVAVLNNSRIDAIQEAHWQHDQGTITIMTYSISGNNRAGGSISYPCHQMGK